MAHIATSGLLEPNLSVWAQKIRFYMEIPEKVYNKMKTGRED